MGAKGTKSKKDYTKLTEEEIILLLANTSFTREEIKRWHQGFIKDCPKGMLDKKKFIEAYRVFYPQGKADKFCSHVFKVFDFDDSGFIDFTEFLIAISVTAQGDDKKKLSMAFRMVISMIVSKRIYALILRLARVNVSRNNKVDRNGKVDEKEMEKIIEAIYDLLGEEHRNGENSPTERVKTIMKKLDKDKNGYLSEQEFVEGCLEDAVLRSLLAPNA